MVALVFGMSNGTRQQQWGTKTYASCNNGPFFPLRKIKQLWRQPHTRDTTQQTSLFLFICVDVCYTIIIPKDVFITRFWFALHCENIFIFREISLPRLILDCYHKQTKNTNRNRIERDSLGFLAPKVIWISNCLIKIGANTLATS